ncbi:MAG: hypothetical protein AAFO72_12080 [Pseudomonadota bacterium]
MLRNIITCVGAIGIASTGHAQDAAPHAENAQISVDVDAVVQVEPGCQLTSLTSSAHLQGVGHVVSETVLIG